MTRLPLACALLLCLAHCRQTAETSGDAAAVVAPPRKPAPTRRVNLRLVPRPTQSTLAAGELLEVNCEAWNGRTQRRDVVVRAETSPRQAVASYHDNVTTFRVEHADQLQVFCRLASEASGSPLGDRPAQVVTVTPGAAVAVRATLQSSHIVAGEALPLRCDLVDAFDNLTEAAAGPVGDMSVVLSRVTAEGTASPSPHLSWHGDAATIEQVGTYRVSCDAAGLPSAPSQTLQVVAGPATQLGLAVEAGTKRAGEPFAARCMAYDAYYNPVDLDMTLHVNADQPQLRHPGEGGERLTLYVKGRYSLFCASKGAAEDETLRSAAEAVDLRGGLPHHIDTVATGWRMTEPCLPQELDHNFTAYVYDAYNNQLDGDAYRLAITAQPRLLGGRPPTIKARGVIFHDVGDYHLAARFLGPFAQGSVLATKTFESDVYVNSTAPRIDLLSPGRAAQLGGDGEAPADAEVWLSGSIADAAGLVSVKVMGQQRTVGAHHRVELLEKLPPPHWGVNVVEIEATNRCNVTSRQVRSFIYSPRYVDPTSADAGDEVAAKALQLQMGPTMLQRAHDPNLTSVARLLEAALTPKLVSERLPKKIYERASDAPAGPVARVSSLFKPYRLERRADVSFYEPIVESLAVLPLQQPTSDAQQRLLLRLKFADLAVPLNVKWGIIDGVGVLRVPQVRIEVNLVTDAQGRATVQAKDGVKVDFPQGHRFDWGSEKLRRYHLNLFGQLLVNNFENVARNTHYLEKFLADGMRHAVVNVLNDAVGALDWRGHPYKLPEPLAGGVKFSRVRNRLKLMPPADDNAPHVAVAIDGNLLPDTEQPVEMPAALRAAWDDAPQVLARGAGAIRHAASEPALSLPADKAFGIMVHDDIINEFLWSMWQSGAFFIPRLDEAIDGLGPQARDLLNGSQLSLYAAAPPVVQPSRQANRFVVSWGDVLVKGLVNTARGTAAAALTDGTEPDRVAVAMFVTLRNEVEVSFDRGSQRFLVHIIEPPADQPPDASSYRIQMVELSAHSEMARQAGLKLQGWLPRFLPALIEKYVNALPPPTVDISGIVGKAPNSTGWRIDEGVLRRPPEGNQTLLQGGVTLEAHL